MKSGLAFSAQKTASSQHVKNMNQTLQGRSYNSVSRRVKVDCVRKQPMKTIGWEWDYGNLLQTYVGSNLKLLTTHFRQFRISSFFLGDNNSIYQALRSLTFHIYNGNIQKKQNRSTLIAYNIMLNLNGGLYLKGVKGVFEGMGTLK